MFPQTDVLPKACASRSPLYRIMEHGATFLPPMPIMELRAVWPLNVTWEGWATAPLTCLNLTVVQAHPALQQDRGRYWHRALPFLVVSSGMAIQFIYWFLLGARGLWKYLFVGGYSRIDPLEEHPQQVNAGWLVSHRGVFASMTVFYSAATFLCAAAYLD